MRKRIRNGVSAIIGAVIVTGVAASTALAAVGDGTADDVSGDSVTEVLTHVQDYGFENLPTFLALFAAMIVFSFSVMLIGLGVRKAFGKLADLFGQA